MTSVPHPLPSRMTQNVAALFGHAPVRAERIEDNQNPSTWLPSIGLRPTGLPDRDKRSCLFAIDDEPGVLVRILAPPARPGIHLTKIESRPARYRPWEYRMFAEIEGHLDPEPTRCALREMGGRTLRLKVRGSYPAV